MSESPASRAYQFLHATYFIPLILAWPLATGLHTIYSNITTSEPPRRFSLGPSRKCRYRLDSDTSHTLNLPDGRKLGYAEYGAPDGRTIFTLHGYPGNRLEGALYDELAKKHNARIICVERPGYGWSSPQLGRKVLDHAKDIEMLADHLELEKYLVMGTSGGGPYALACAAALPADKLKGVAVVVGLGAPDMSLRGQFLLNRLGWGFVHRYSAWLTKFYVSRQIESQLHLDDEYRLSLVLKEPLSKMPTKDAEVLQDSELREDFMRAWLNGTRQAYAQGLDHVVQDSRAMVSDWGFRIEDIRYDLPVDLWYGKRDGAVPGGHGPLIAARLGPKANLRLLDETHLSLQVKYQEDILTSLLDKW